MSSGTVLRIMSKGKICAQIYTLRALRELRGSIFKFPLKNKS